MSFCIKCGTAAKKDWLHCAKCGEPIRKNSTPKLSKKTSDEKVEISQAKPAVNGVPFGVKIEKISKGDEKIENVNSSIFYKIAAAVIASILILIIIIAPKHNNSSQVTQDQIVEESPTPINPFSIDKASFYSSVGSFLREKCKPTITKPGPQFSETMADMTLKDMSDLSKFPDDYNLDQATISEWSSTVDLALMHAAAYEQKLSNLYFDIFDVYRSEMQKYRTKFNSYFGKADSIARELCYSDTPTNKQLSRATQAISNLQSSWIEFNQWYDDTKNVADNISAQYDAEYKASTTPQCTEIKTSNPNYNIVKCTNIP
jgi:hypothetical protein